MIVLKYPAEALSGTFSSLGWWEVDSYIGLIGLFFLLVFGAYRTWRKGSNLNSLLAPTAVLIFLSIGQIYSLINHLPIPLVDSERISSRFFILPLAVLIVLGSIQMQELLVKLGYRTFFERVSASVLILLHTICLTLTRMAGKQRTSCSPASGSIRSQVILPPMWYFWCIWSSVQSVTLLTFCVFAFS
jgi:hypothetical protein